MTRDDAEDPREFAALVLVCLGLIAAFITTTFGLIEAAKYIEATFGNAVLTAYGFAVAVAFFLLGVFLNDGLEGLLD